MECCTSIEIVSPVDLKPQVEKHVMNQIYSTFSLKCIANLLQNTVLIHWLYKELESEQPPSDHIDKLASKLSVQ